MPSAAPGGLSQFGRESQNPDEQVVESGRGVIHENQQQPNFELRNSVVQQVGNFTVESPNTILQSTPQRVPPGGGPGGSAFATPAQRPRTPVRGAFHPFPADAATPVPGSAAVPVIPRPIPRRPIPGPGGPIPGQPAPGIPPPIPPSGPPGPGTVQPGPNMISYDLSSFDSQAPPTGGGGGTPSANALLQQGAGGDEAAADKFRKTLSKGQLVTQNKCLKLAFAPLIPSIRGPAPRLYSLEECRAYNKWLMDAVRKHFQSSELKVGIIMAAGGGGGGGGGTGVPGQPGGPQVSPINPAPPGGDPDYPEAFVNKFGTVTRGGEEVMRGGLYTYRPIMNRIPRHMDTEPRPGRISNFLAGNAGRMGVRTNRIPADMAGVKVRFRSS